MIDLNALLQPFLESVLTILAPILIAMLAVYLNKLLTKMKAELSNEQLVYLTELAHQFVNAAEQSGLTAVIENVGMAKKEMVMALLQAEANARGIKIDVEILSAIIEAAVVEEFGLSKTDWTTQD